MKKILFFVLLATLTKNAAATTLSDATLVSIISKAMVPAASIIQNKSAEMLGGFALYQWIRSFLNLLGEGADLNKVWAQALASLSWIGVSVFVFVNAPTFISNVGNEIFHLPGLTLPSVSSVVDATAGLAGVILGIAALVSGPNNVAGQVMLDVAIFVFGVGSYFAMKIFLLQMELGFQILMAPVSLSFLTLHSMKDVGIAPFKALVSLFFRLVIVMVVLSAFQQVGAALSETLDGVGISTIVSGLGAFFTSLGMGLMSFAMLCFLMFKSDSIAAMMSSGSSSFSPGDLTSAVAAGVAGGMAAHAANGAVEASIKGTAGQSMANFMKNTGSGGMGNAGGGWPSF